MNKEQFEIISKKLAQGDYQSAKALVLGFLEEEKNDILSWKVLGFIETKLGLHTKALEAKREALRLAPTDPESHTNLANTLKQIGEIELAEGHYREAIKLSPRFEPAINHLAGILADSNRKNEAIQLIENALTINSKAKEITLHLLSLYLKNNRYSDVAKLSQKSLKNWPEDADILTKKILAEIELGNLKEASNLCRKILKQSPSHESTLINLGVIMTKQHKLIEATELFEKVISINPDSAAAHRNLALLYTDRKKYDKALNHIMAVIQSGNREESVLHLLIEISMNVNENNKYDANKINIILPSGDGPVHDSAKGYLAQRRKDYVEAESFYKRAIEAGFSSKLLMCNYGALLIECRRYIEAIRLLEAAAEQFKNYPPIIANLGFANVKLGFDQKAEALYVQAIALDPNYKVALLNYSAFLQSSGRYQEAIQQFKKILALESNHREAKIGLSQALMDNGEIKEAIKINEEVIIANPNDVDAKWNLAIKLLQAGELAKGFEAYEIRWEWKDFPSPKRKFLQPQWTGKESLNKRRILVHYEQGLGDTVQFSRYLTKFIDLGADVVFFVPRPLISLLGTLNGNISFIDTLPEDLEFDFHIPLLSCPYVFKTDTNSIPSQVPYLTAESDLKNKFKLQFMSGQSHIGFAFSGNSAHVNDRNRSFDLKLFRTIFELEKTIYHCIQKDIKYDDIEILRRFENVQIHSDELIDFSHTAALIDGLDLIVSVDTSVAHVAGALGKKVFLVLGYGSDWRWQTSGTRSEWYPTFKLYRRAEFKSDLDLFNLIAHDIKVEISNTYV